MILSILCTDIGEDFIPSFIREVHINIGHRDTGRIEKSFEEESIFEWIDIRDS